MIAYLDNAATTAVSDKVLERMCEVLKKHYGNPASAHTLGFEAERLISEAKKAMAGRLGCDISEIFITSGGTESINTVIYGVCGSRPKHIAASSIEHPAVINAMLEVEKNGNEISFVNVDDKGRLLTEELEQLLDSRKIDLFNLIWVNNEVGSIQNAASIAELIKSRQPGCLIHLDATQAIGKLKINLKALKIDLLSGSAHKLHGPKGVGILYKKKGCNIKPLLVGGGQQNGFRSGTENAAGTAALACAIDEAYEDFEAKAANLHMLKRHCVELLSRIDDVVIHNPPSEEFSDSIVSFAAKGVRSEVLLHELSAKGIYVSAGSACHSLSKSKGSHVLNALHIPLDLQEATIRISMSAATTMEEIEYAAAAIKEAVPFLRKYIHK